MPYLSWKSFDWDKGGVAIFEAIKDKRNVFYLDSSLKDDTLGRYSFLGYEPFYIFKGDADEEPFSRLRELLKLYQLDVPRCNLPLVSGAVGYFSYDLGLQLERIKKQALDDLKLPALFLGFYDTIIAIDHFRNKLFIFSSGFPERGHLSAKKRSDLRLRQFIADLSRLKFNGLRYKNMHSKFSPMPKSNFTKEEYLWAIRRAKDYIRKGDIYQVNLSQRFATKTATGAWELYRRLRQVSPSRFSAYLDCTDFQIASSSPERFLFFDGKNVSTRPMKGTRPRGSNRKDDRQQKDSLLKSAKDRAELLMIVDLLRNDLGRVCEYGSVKVRSLRTLEAYATVYQTTATVEGRLHKDKDRLDLIKACFPGGSITGCPKIRSMQIIEELEPTRRSIYCGSLGYLGFNNTLDLNILIRTILKKNNTLYFQAGGGIVADSELESEYEETLVKAKGIFKTIGN